MPEKSRAEGMGGLARRRVAARRAGWKTRPVDAARLSLNQITTRRWTLRRALDGCVSAGIPAIGVTREHLAAHVHAHGLKDAVAAVKDSGLRVSSLRVAASLTAHDAAPALADVRAAVDEAKAIGAACLVLGVGGLEGRDLVGARARARSALASLAPYAASKKVRIALEPEHPVAVADRGVLSTLDQALDWATPFDAAAVGVVIDTATVFWDPRVLAAIGRAGAEGRIALVQIADVLSPLPPDPLLARALPGDGVVDFAPLLGAVEDAGYAGDIEVEVLNEKVWHTEGTTVLGDVRRKFAAL